MADGSDHLEVSGTGTAGATPDLALVRLRVEHDAPTVAEALGGCAEAVTGVLAAVEALGVAERDRQTTGLRVEPRWGGEDRPRVVGQTASQSLTVRVRDVDLVGRVVDGAAGAAGEGFRLDGLDWVHSAPAALHAQARERAFADARAKAVQLAGLAGRELGEVVRVGEGGGDGGPGVLRARFAEMAADQPVSAGEQEVSASLTVRWRLR